MRTPSVNNERGFSLVSALVGVGIVSVMALGIAVTVGNGIDGISHMRNSALAEDITGMVSGMMGDPDYCALNFKGIKITALSLPAVLANKVTFKDITSVGKSGNNVIIGSGKRYQNILQVEGITLNAESSLGANRYMGSIKITMKGNTGYNLYFNRSIPIQIATDQTGNITACSKATQSPQGATQGVWSETCTDFSAKGWQTQDACVKDGRWHKVYETSSSGAVILGTRVAVRDYIRQGAQVGVGVGIPNPYFGASFELCASVVVSNDSSNQVECLTYVRTGGGDFNTATAKISRDNAAYFTDGTVVVRNENPPSSGKFKVPLVWRIHF